MKVNKGNSYSRRFSRVAKYAAGYLPCGHKLTKPRVNCDMCEHHVKVQAVRMATQ